MSDVSEQQATILATSGPVHEGPPPGESAPEVWGSGDRVRESPAPEHAPASLRGPDEDSMRLAEALIFASAEPVTLRGLTRLLPDDIDADAVLLALRGRYAGRGVELVEAGGGV